MATMEALSHLFETSEQQYGNCWPAAGFIGKFMLFSAGLGRGPGSGTATRVLAVLLALNSALSLFYYLRLLSVMYRRQDATHLGAQVAAHLGAQDATHLGAQVAAPLADTSAPAEGVAHGVKGSLLAGTALGLIGLAILVLGTAPGPALSLIASLALK